MKVEKMLFPVLVSSLLVGCGTGYSDKSMVKAVPGVKGYISGPRYPKIVVKVLEGDVIKFNGKVIKLKRFDGIAGVVKTVKNNYSKMDFYMLNDPEHKPYSIVRGELTKDMPKTGTATYKGGAFDEYWTFKDLAGKLGEYGYLQELPNVEDIESAIEPREAIFTVDFGEKKLTGKIDSPETWEHPTDDVIFQHKFVHVEADIEGNSFKGDKKFRRIGYKNHDGSESYFYNVSHVEGSFFGPNAAELGGVYKVNQEGAKETITRGGFVAKKQ